MLSATRVASSRMPSLSYISMSVDLSAMSVGCASTPLQHKGEQALTTRRLMDTHGGGELMGQGAQESACAHGRESETGRMSERESAGV
jgi:hypothetical protein